MAGSGRPEREIPYCTIFLVAATLVCHSMVLSGNLATAKAFAFLGDSTEGWSDVGLAMSKSLSTELDSVMSNVSGTLSTAIGEIGQVQSGLDSAISVAGHISDAAIQFYAKVRNASGVAPSVDPKKEKRSEPAKAKKAAVEAVLLATPSMSADASGEPDMSAGMVEAEISSDAHVNYDMKDEVEEAPRRSMSLLQEQATEKAAVTVQHRYSAKSRAHLAVLAGAQVKIGSMLAVTSLPGALPFGQPLDLQDTLGLSGGSLQRISKWNVENMTPAEFKQEIRSEIKVVVSQLMDNTTGLVDAFFYNVKPALVQVGAWLGSFGEKLQAVIEQFSTTLDRVQKIFDQLMSELNKKTVSDVKMREYTYTLFDTSNSGTCSYWDLTNTSVRYGVPALKGEKSMQLILKYSTDGDLEIDEEEFSHMVHDSTLPGVMETVLRSYAKHLSSIAGNVAAGVMRDEVAKAVVDWIALVQDQNETEVEWVAMRVTNASLPLPFTAAVMRRLYTSMVAPDNLQLVDFGHDFVKMMVEQNVTHTLLALDLISNPTWWDDEGFDTFTLPLTLERVTTWVSDCIDEVKEEREAEKTATTTTTTTRTTAAAANNTATTNTAEKAALLQLFGAFRHATRTTPAEEVIAQLPLVARRYGQDAVLSLRRNESVVSGAAQAALFSSGGAQALREQLLGGSSASSQGSDPEMKRALKKGQKAVPATLEFAKFLAWNATADTDAYQKESFDYSSTSSSALDTFANQIQAMIKKIQNFLNTMKEYSEPVGIDRLQKQIHDFTRRAADDVVDVLMRHIDEQLDELLPNSTDAAAARKDGVAGALFNVTDAAVPMVTGVWTTLLTAMTMLQQTLPGVVDDMIFARKEVSAVAATMKSTFGIFKVNGPPIFLLLSKVYKMLWTAYFWLFAVLTSSVLFYGFWASGYCGGPQASAVEGYEAPQGFLARCRVCCASCNACLKSCHDSHLCFWSVVLIMEILVLVLFLVSIVLCLLAGIKAFMAAGCAQIYILGDNSICQGVLGTIRTWLLTFWEDASVLLGDACSEKQLLTCDLIGARLKGSVINTVLGSMLASVLSFQLILESAVLHERARWRRIFDEESKKV